ncbi:MAG: MarC family protein [Draconibacterium sp.]
MTEYLTFSLTVFTGFFAVMNPIANTPIFLGIVDGETKSTKLKIAKTATVTAFVIVAIFVILGKYIFELFGITIPAFKITGGILIFYIGFEMLMSKKSKVHNTQNNDDISSIAISPLAIPILAGPGTIVTAMNFVTKGDFIHIAIVIVLFAFIVYLTYIAFTLSDKIVDRVGQNLIAVIGKIMGLILAIIGTGMVIEGVKLGFKV